MHRKHIRATDATTGVDVDVPTAIWADGQFLIYLGGELFTQFVVQSHNTSTDNAVARWDGTTGHLIQDSTVIIDDAGAVTGVTTMNGVPPGDWVRGPVAGGSTDNAITRWDGTTGRLVQNSTVIINDSGDITGVGALNGIDLSRLIRYTPAYFPYHNEVLCVDNFDPITNLPIGASGRTVKIAGGGVMTDVATINTRDPMAWVDGPASHVATNNHIALWDTNSGRLIKDSVVNISTGGDITTPGDMTPTTVGGVPVGVLVKSSNPAPHPDNAIARWDASSPGHPIQDSTVFISDTGAFTGITSLNNRAMLNFVSNVNGTGTVGNVPKFTAFNDIDDSGVIASRIVTNGGFNSSATNDIPFYNDTTGKVIRASGVSIQNIVRNETGLGSTDNAVVRWDGATGKLTQNSIIIVSDVGGITGVNTINGVQPAAWVQGPSSGGSTDNTLAVWDGTSGRFLKNGGAAAVAVDPGTGEITTPVGVLVHSTATHTDNAVVRWDGTGFHTQDSVVIVDDSGNMSGVGTLNTRTIANFTESSSTFPTIDRIMVSSLASSRRIAPSGVPITSVVVGPVSAVDGNIAVYDTTSGKLIKDSGVPLTAASGLYTRNFTTVAGFAGSSGFDVVPSTTFNTEATTNTLQIIIFMPYAVANQSSGIVVSASWSGMSPTAGGFFSGTCGMQGGGFSSSGSNIVFSTTAASIPVSGLMVFACSFQQSSITPTFSMHVNSNTAASHNIYSGVMQVTKGGIAPSGS